MRIIAQQLANLENVGADNLRLDVGFRPEGLEQLVVSNQALRILDQVTKNGEGTRSERKLLFAAPYTFVAEVEPIGSELSHLADWTPD